MGSPPQVRGKRKEVLRGSEEAGITPAGAGKTGFTELTGDDAKDHPRRCGENFHGCLPFWCSGGSPPQVRGKPLRVSGGFVLPGITPAGAGKTGRMTN